MKQTHAVLYERKILQQLEHPFILRLHTTYQSRDACYFLLELIQGGELISRLTSFSDGEFPPDECRFHASATILALEYIHSKNMVLALACWTSPSQPWGRCRLSLAEWVS